MAEFTEIMRQAKRLCAAHGGMCSMRNCPLDSGEACRLNVDLDGENYNELECIIMDLAAEHPEPVYPSWEEGWKQLFPDADIKRTFCPEIFGDRYKCDWCYDDNDDNDNCDECLERPMPAEVAEKLGIKPITKDHAIKHYCDNCKYARREITAEPCVRCKHGVDEGSFLTAPDLWEAAE